MKPTRFPLPALISALILPVFGADPPDENPVIEFEAILGPGQTCAISPSQGLPIFATRAAKRALAKLLPGKPITVLAIDRYGLKVRGVGQNGPITGWVGQKSALENDGTKLKALAALYQRQIVIERLIAQKRPAIGMNLRELTRIYGPATRHNIVAEGDKRTEAAVWIFNEKVDLNDTLDLGTDTALLKVDVETGRITANLIDGVARSIDVNLEGVAADIPTVPDRVEPPFNISTANPLTAEK